MRGERREPHEEPKEKISAEKTRDLMLAADLYRKVGHPENAGVLYKRMAKAGIEVPDMPLAEDRRVPIDRNVEGLMNKIARWLENRTEWNKPEQQKAIKQRVRPEDNYEQSIRYPDSFSVTEEPEFKALGSNRREIEEKLQSDLGCFKVQREKYTDHPYETGFEGVQLANYGDTTLVIGGSEVRLEQASHITPVFKEDQDSLEAQLQSQD